MALPDYSAIGSPFGKLLKAKPKGIILAKTVPAESIPFLQDFQNGSHTLQPLEESFVEEMAEDIFETTYTLTLSYRGKHYLIQISDSNDFWLLKEVHITANMAGGTSKKKKRISIPIILLIAVSAAGYMYQFGLFDKKGTKSVEANPTVYDSYALPATAIPKPVEQNPEQKTVAQSLKTPTSTTSTTANWEQEKANLQKQIATLTKENEALKKQLTAGKSVAFVIKQGQTGQEIAKAAKDAGIVESSDAFYQAIVAAKAEQALAPGSYLVVPGTPYSSLIEQLTEGAVHVTHQ
jgi:flagellar basal body-associated protein FliL